MSDSIIEVRSIGFNSAVHHTVEQKRSKLMDRVTIKTGLTGKATTFPRQGGSDMRRKTGRHEKTTFVNVLHSNRMVFVAHYDWFHPVDDQDEMENVINPAGNLAISAGTAAMRNVDVVIIAALQGNANSGETGTTLVALPSGQKQASGTGAFSLTKIAEGQKNFRDNDQEITPDMTTLVISPSALEDITLDTSDVFRSRDFNPFQMLMTGEIQLFMGMFWVISTKLPEVSSGVRACYMFQRAAVGLGVWNLAKGSFDKRPDLSNAMQVGLEQSLGAVRIEEALVFEHAFTE